MVNILWLLLLVRHMYLKILKYIFIPILNSIYGCTFTYYELISEKNLLWNSKMYWKGERKRHNILKSYNSYHSVSSKIIYPGILTLVFYYS